MDSNFENTGRAYLDELFHRKKKAPRDKKWKKRLAAKILARVIVNVARASRKIFYSGYCAVGAGIKAANAVREEISVYNAQLKAKKEDNSCQQS